MAKLKIYFAYLLSISVVVATILGSGVALGQGVVWGDKEVVKRLTSKRIPEDQRATLPGVQTAPVGTQRPLADGGDEGFTVVSSGCVNVQGRQVCVSNFLIGVHEVTNAQYRNFVANHSSGGYRQQNLNLNVQPVVRVSLQDALRYAQWLSQQTGKRFRLPTQAEWEYVAHSQRVDISNVCSFANVGDLTAKNTVNNSWTTADCEDGYGVAAPVGSKAPGQFGVHDIIGNVWEWVCTDNVNKCAVASNNIAPVARGGAWSNGPGSYGADAVLDVSASGRQRSPIIGFRLVQDPY